MRNFWHGEAPASEHFGATWPGFGRAFLSSPVDAASFGHGDPRRLMFSLIFHLDFCEPEEYTGDHAAQRAAQIDLLRYDNPHATLTSVCQGCGAFVLLEQRPELAPALASLWITTFASG